MRAALAVDDRALGVVGTREAGKSSTLAWLALAGTEVLCDDLLVIDGRSTFTGPRSIDLREDAAERLGAGEAIGVTGARERGRLRLAPAGDRRVLAGFVFLARGDGVTCVRSVPESGSSGSRHTAGYEWSRPGLTRCSTSRHCPRGRSAGGGAGSHCRRSAGGCSSSPPPNRLQKRDRLGVGLRRTPRKAQLLDVDQLSIDRVTVPARRQLEAGVAPEDLGEVRLRRARSTSPGSRSPTRASIDSERERRLSTGGSPARAPRKRPSWSGCATTTSQSAATDCRASSPMRSVGEPSSRRNRRSWRSGSPAAAAATRVSTSRRAWPQPREELGIQRLMNHA